MIVLYAILGLILALLAIAFILPGKYHIEKSVIIKRPVAFVMNRVADLNYYASWNPWQQSDSDIKAEITGVPATRGHKYKWEGRTTGKGSLTLRDIDEKHVHFDLEFIKPWRSKANDNWLFEEWGNDETKVTWQNDGNLPYPMGRLMGAMINKGLNKLFVKGLNNLKIMAESA